MKRFLLIALIIAGGLLWVQSARLRSEKRERRRLESNQTALMPDVEIYRTKAGKAAASNMVLNLRVSELERLRAADAESIRDLGIKLVGDGRGVDQARLGRMPRREHRYPPAGRTPGAAALPLHPLGNQSDTAGGHVVEPAYANRIH